MPKTVRINLALQGGGAHGAFTWGALDRLLQEEWLEIAAISGTSAGALNGAALKSGWVEDGREGARAALRVLWGQVSGLGDLRIPAWMQGFVPDPYVAARTLEMSPLVAISDAVSRMVSPYDYGPFYRNPLERIVRRFNFDQICEQSRGPALHICATRVRDGKVKVFTGDDIDAKVIMASACLPTIFQAVEIAGPDGISEAYWDGGYTGNPALFPLYHPELPNDILIININPLERKETPRSAQDIQNRVNEISFNSSLLRELRAIDFVQRLIADGKIVEGSMKNVRIHMVADDDLMNDLSVATKTVPLPSVIGQLHDAGYAAAEGFLADHAASLGKAQTLVLRDMFA
ncbi:MULTISPECIES: patatin-like phospholipase family protein [unclassified Marinovum]